MFISVLRHVGIPVVGTGTGVDVRWEYRVGVGVGGRGCGGPRDETNFIKEVPSLLRN